MSTGGQAIDAETRFPADRLTVVAIAVIRSFFLLLLFFFSWQEHYFHSVSFLFGEGEGAVVVRPTWKITCHRIKPNQRPIKTVVRFYGCFSFFLSCTTLAYLVKHLETSAGNVHDHRRILRTFVSCKSVLDLKIFRHFVGVGKFIFGFYWKHRGNRFRVFR